MSSYRQAGCVCVFLNIIAVFESDSLFMLNEGVCAVKRQRCECDD